MPKTKTDPTARRYLLDANLLLSLCWEELETHETAKRWFLETGIHGWATCELTEAAFLRLSMNPKVFPEAASFREVLGILEALRTTGRHSYLAASKPHDTKLLESLTVRGYRQVTDGLLLATARAHGSILATFDQGIAHLATKPEWKSALLVLPR